MPVACLAGLLLVLGCALPAVSGAGMKDVFEAHWIVNNSAMLGREMRAKQFVFILGMHGSGTTLLNLVLGSHPHASILRSSSGGLLEGHALQGVFAAEDRLTERNTSLLTVSSKLRLYTAWRRYWDVDQRILVEKSPFDALRSRFLQAVFTPERTFIIAILRHPIAMLQRYWTVGRQVHDCLDLAIRMWLQIHYTMFADLQLTAHSAAVYFEHLVTGDTAAIVDALLVHLGLDPGVSLGDTHRRGFHGDHMHINIDSTHAYAWAELFETTVMREHRAACMATFDRHGSSVREFGYALDDPRKLLYSRTVAPFLVQ